MKRIFCAIILAALLFAGCSQYAEPDVGELMTALLENQDVAKPTEATEAEISAIFEINPEDVESRSVYYSGKGGYADIAAVFVMNSEDLTQEAADALDEYRLQRYEDFKGYAPVEAEKLENGRVLTYGRYVLLLVLPDIDKAVEAADAAFKA